MPGSPSFPPQLLERRTMRVLVVAQLLGALGLAAGGTAGALLAGCGLLGDGNAAVMLARYAAADLASRRGRAISVVVAAASVGAVAGPNLLGPAGALAGVVGLPAPTGLFLLAIPAFLGAAVVLVVFLRPDPLQVAGPWRRPPSNPPSRVASERWPACWGAAISAWRWWCSWSRTSPWSG